VELQDRAEALKPQDEIKSSSLLRWAHADLPVKRLVFSPNGKTLASLSGDERAAKLVLWNLEKRTAKLLPTRLSKTGELQFAPDGATLIQNIGLADVILWDVASGRQRPLQLPEGCSSLSVSPDGATMVLFRPKTSDLLVWDIATRQARHSIRLTATGKVDLRAAVAPRGKQIGVEVQQQDSVGVWLIDVTSSTWTRLPGPGWSDWPAAKLTFSPDGTVLAKVGIRTNQYVETKCDSTVIGNPFDASRPIDVTVGK
jgi:WD40 repeat protein